MFDQGYWYKKTNKKFLHNVDTFYYSVKLYENFTTDSMNPSVLNLRALIDSYHVSSDREDFTEVNWKKPIFYRAGIYADIYRFRLECPDHFDVFIAPSVPRAMGSVTSVTSEIIVQLRSCKLWELGVKMDYDLSMDFVRTFCDQLGFHIKEVKENRIDFCWHTNALQDPETYLRIDNLSRMQVSRFRGCNYHYKFSGEDEYESDYLSLGTRGGKCFLRIYLKTKEVVEQGYKGWFFYVWFFNGLISRYDLYCLEKAYKKQNWNYIDVARLEFALEFLVEDNDIIEHNYICSLIHPDNDKYDYAAIKKEADLLTPKITKVLNIEYQVMRKMTKSFDLVDFNRNSGVDKRIYDFLDNRKLITDYLTHYTFRLVDPKDDDNKSRADYTDFWKRLRGTKQVDVCVNTHDLKLVRDYSSKLDMDIRKTKALKSIASYAAFFSPDEFDPEKDAETLLCMVNDNDINDISYYKSKYIKSIDYDSYEVSKYTDIYDGRIKLEELLKRESKDDTK